MKNSYTNPKVVSLVSNYPKFCHNNCSVSIVQISEGI